MPAFAFGRRGSVPREGCGAGGKSRGVPGRNVTDRAGRRLDAPAGLRLGLGRRHSSRAFSAAESMDR